ARVPPAASCPDTRHVCSLYKDPDARIRARLSPGAYALSPSLGFQTRSVRPASYKSSVDRDVERDRRSLTVGQAVDQRVHRVGTAGEAAGIRPEAATRGTGVEAAQLGTAVHVRVRQLDAAGLVRDVGGLARDAVRQRDDGGSGRGR